MKTFYTYLLTGLLALSGFTKVALADAVVVVASGNKQDLDLEAVKKIFKGDVSKWDDGKAIVIVVPDVASPEGGAMLSKLYGMNAGEYKKYWMQKVFKGEAASPPESKAAGATVDFLKAYPNAIGIVPSVNAVGVRKVIKID